MYPKTRSKVPSRFCSHPSNTGTTSCPLLYTWPLEGATVPTTSESANTKTALFILALFLMLLIVVRAGIHLLRPLLEFFLVVLLGQVMEAHPGEAHVIDRTVAESDPVPWIGVVPVGGGVVVPADDMNDRPRGKHRRDVVRVVVDEHPGKVVFCAAERLDLALDMDCLDAHPLAAVVHVRLEGLHDGGLG